MRAKRKRRELGSLGYTYLLIKYKYFPTKVTFSVYILDLIHVKLRKRNGQGQGLYLRRIVWYSRAEVRSLLVTTVESEQSFYRCAAAELLEFFRSYFHGFGMADCYYFSSEWLAGKE